MQFEPIRHWPLAKRVLVDGVVIGFYSALAQACFYAWTTSHDRLVLLPLAMNGLVVALYLFRRSASTLSTSPAAWLVSITGTCLPMLMRPDPIAQSVFPYIGLVFQELGLMAAIAALLSLQRSLGIVPANRGIQEGGMYRWVRHPLYMAELLFYTGFVLQWPSRLNAVLLFAEVLFQVFRAIAEERLLLADPRYAAYLARVRYRFIPGLL